MEDEDEDLYEFNLFDLLDDTDITLCDRSRNELENDPKCITIINEMKKSKKSLD